MSLRPSKQATIFILSLVLALAALPHNTYTADTDPPTEPELDEIELEDIKIKPFLGQGHSIYKHDHMTYDLSYYFNLEGLQDLSLEDCQQNFYEAPHQKGQDRQGRFPTLSNCSQYQASFTTSRFYTLCQDKTVQVMKIHKTRNGVDELYTEIDMTTKKTDKENKIQKCSLLKSFRIGKGEFLAAVCQKEIAEKVPDANEEPSSSAKVVGDEATAVVAFFWFSLGKLALKKAVEIDLKFEEIKRIEVMSDITNKKALVLLFGDESSHSFTSIETPNSFMPDSMVIKTEQKLSDFKNFDDSNSTIKSITYYDRGFLVTSKQETTYQATWCYFEQVAITTAQPDESTEPQLKTYETISSCGSPFTLELEDKSTEPTILPFKNHWDHSVDIVTIQDNLVSHFKLKTLHSKTLVNRLEYSSNFDSHKFTNNLPFTPNRLLVIGEKIFLMEDPKEKDTTIKAVQIWLQTKNLMEMKIENQEGSIATFLQEDNNDIDFFYLITFDRETYYKKNINSPMFHLIAPLETEKPDSEGDFYCTLNFQYKEKELFQTAAYYKATYDAKNDEEVRFKSPDKVEMYSDSKRVVKINNLKCNNPKFEISKKDETSTGVDVKMYWNDKMEVSSSSSIKGDLEWVGGVHYISKYRENDKNKFSLLRCQRIKKLGLECNTKAELAPSDFKMTSENKDTKQEEENAEVRYIAGVQCNRNVYLLFDNRGKVDVSPGTKRDVLGNYAILVVPEERETLSENEKTIKFLGKSVFDKGDMRCHNGFVHFYGFSLVAKNSDFLFYSSFPALLNFPNYERERIEELVSFKEVSIPQDKKLCPVSLQIFDHEDHSFAIQSECTNSSGVTNKSIFKFFYDSDDLEQIRIDEIYNISAMNKPTFCVTENDIHISDLVEFEKIPENDPEKKNNWLIKASIESQVDQISWYYSPLTEYFGIKTIKKMECDKRNNLVYLIAENEEKEQFFVALNGNAEANSLNRIHSIKKLEAKADTIVGGYHDIAADVVVLTKNSGEEKLAEGFRIEKRAPIFEFMAKEGSNGIETFNIKMRPSEDSGDKFMRSSQISIDLKDPKEVFGAIKLAEIENGKKSLLKKGDDLLNIVIPKGEKGKISEIVYKSESKAETTINQPVQPIEKIESFLDEKITKKIEGKILGFLKISEKYTFVWTSNNSNLIISDSEKPEVVSKAFSRDILGRVVKAKSFIVKNKEENGISSTDLVILLIISEESKQTLRAIRGTIEGFQNIPGFKISYNADLIPDLREVYFELIDPTEQVFMVAGYSNDPAQRFIVQNFQVPSVPETSIIFEKTHKFSEVLDKVIENFSLAFSNSQVSIIVNTKDSTKFSMYFLRFYEQGKIELTKKLPDLSIKELQKSPISNHELVTTETRFKCVLNPFKELTITCIVGTKTLYSTVTDITIIESEIENKISRQVLINKSSYLLRNPKSYKPFKVAIQSDTKQVVVIYIPVDRYEGLKAKIVTFGLDESAQVEYQLPNGMDESSRYNRKTAILDGQAPIEIQTEKEFLDFVDFGIEKNVLSYSTFENGIVQNKVQIPSLVVHEPLEMDLEKDTLELKDEKGQIQVVNIAKYFTLKEDDEKIPTTGTSTSEEKSSSSTSSTTTGTSSTASDQEPPKPKKNETKKSAFWIYLILASITFIIVIAGAVAFLILRNKLHNMNRPRVGSNEVFDDINSNGDFDLINNGSLSEYSRL